jgi:SGNH domain (fused to AT3 domains)
MFVTGGGCPAIPAVYSDAHYHCRAMQEHIQTVLKRYPSIRTIAIAGSWNGIFSEEEDFYYQNEKDILPLESPNGRQSALQALGVFLRSLSKTYHVYFLLDNPASKLFDPIQMIGNRLDFDDRNHVVPDIRILLEQEQLNEEIRRVALSAGVNIIEPNRMLCPEGMCRRVDAEGYPIYQNAGHLSARFVELQANYIDSIFSDH